MSSLHITPRRAMILLAIRHHEHGLTFSQLSEIIPGSENQLEQHIEYLREHILLDVVPGKRLRDPSMRIIDMGRFVSDIVGSGFAENYYPEKPPFAYTIIGEMLWFYMPHFANFNANALSTDNLVDDAVKRGKHNIRAYIHKEFIAKDIIYKNEPKNPHADAPITYSLSLSIPPEHTKGPLNDMIVKAMQNRSLEYTIDNIIERIDAPLRAHCHRILRKATEAKHIIRRTCPDGQEGFSALPSITCKNEKTA